MTQYNEESKRFAKKSDIALQTARFIKEVDPNNSVTRSYYSMYYSARSALIVNGYPDVTRHEGINNVFSNIFVKTGRFPKEVFRLMGRIEHDRYDADYDSSVDFSTQEAEKRIEDAELFVETVAAMLERERMTNTEIGDEDNLKSKEQDEDKSECEPEIGI